VTDRDALLAMLDEVRRQGYATNVSSFREGVCGLAAPIRDHTGAVVASVGCCVPESRFGDDHIAALREPTAHAAAAISRELGWMQAVEPLAGSGRRSEAGAAR
jgi:DNA-binding IclR family transcriptional regulator